MNKKNEVKKLINVYHVYKVLVFSVPEYILVMFFLITADIYQRTQICRGHSVSS